LEDNVLIKGDGLPTYNFANVVDDYLMGITHCIRGVEYLSSTPKYNHIYDCMGWQRPHYIHLQPIMKDGQNKLSKRDGAASYDDFKAKGFLPIAIINYIALLGWSPKDENEKFDLNGLLSRFNLSGLSKSPSIFDEVKMRYINSLHIKDLTLEQYHAHAIPFYDKLDYLKNFDFYDEEGLKYLSNLLCSRTEIFSDITHLTAFLTEFENFDLDLFVNDKWKTCKKMAKQMLDQIAKKINSNEFDVLDSDSVDRFCAEFGYKKGQVLWIFRIAVTGAKNTPGGAGEMARLLGKNQIISRIKSTLNRLY
ncbi:MAG: glutamate--tRNA ligase family protein, partial [Firmicutes bacterium]|nr:glutamate--tRNA ligase family protein [Bacillota bacterium]